nr:hypothetical protein [Rhodococcus wratislaviensis]GLK40759.1 hypothetical protein GCM10017611_76340 [Rhodococcus wratislaviensis]
MTTCAVLGCPETNIRPHALKETFGMEYPAQAAICEPHIAEVSNPAADWSFLEVPNPLTGSSSRAILLGSTLHGLSEYAIESLETRVSTGSHSQVDSPVATRGNYITLHARRRGDTKSSELKLIVPFGQQEEIAGQLEAVANLLRKTL